MIRALSASYAPGATTMPSPCSNSRRRAVTLMRPSIVAPHNRGAMRYKWRPVAFADACEQKTRAKVPSSEVYDEWAVTPISELSGEDWQMTASADYRVMPLAQHRP